MWSARTGPCLHHNGHILFNTFFSFSHVNQGWLLQNSQTTIFWLLKFSTLHFNTFYIYSIWALLWLDNLFTCELCNIICLWVWCAVQYKFVLLHYSCFRTVLNCSRFIKQTAQKCTIKIKLKDQKTIQHLADLSNIFKYKHELQLFKYECQRKWVWSKLKGLQYIALLFLSLFYKNQ